ncbi:MAG: TetR/AcrR family transcriptional regulator [Ruminococcus sp.]|nr:TetR/AcrR family transcriptional regulator [Ruminococcus sp.]MDE6539689.1 TetR/AcrR family transcriptional regulator [Ruminococcus sp.]
MDLRVEKTKRNIINAFLNLRSRKPIEKITIKEIAEIAQINKATFYLHYHDIYELSESLERDVIQSALTNIEHPDTVFTDNKLFVRELVISIFANEQLIRILFEGNRSGRFIELFEAGITEFIKKSYPEYNPSLERKMTITYLIYGGYYTYLKYCDNGVETVLKIIEKCSSAIIEPYK